MVNNIAYIIILTRVLISYYSRSNIKSTRTCKPTAQSIHKITTLFKNS